MRAFVLSKYKEQLRLAEVAEPTVGEGDVLVRVDAASLGNDFAGTVIRVGAKVRGFKPGDEVYARPSQDRIGAFAERIAVAESDLALERAGWGRSRSSSPST